MGVEQCLNFRTKTFVPFPAEPARARTADAAETAELAAVQGLAWATLQPMVPILSSWGTRPRPVPEALVASEPPGGLAGLVAMLLAPRPPMTATAIKEFTILWQALSRETWVEISKNFGES